MPDPTSTRASTRVRTKSARALENEGTEALLAARGPARATRSKAPQEKVAPKPRKSKYCVCKEHRTGPMIECGECGNWFHFGCVGLTEEEAEKIREYLTSHFPSVSLAGQGRGLTTDVFICADCEVRTESKTTCKCSYPPYSPDNSYSLAMAFLTTWQGAGAAKWLVPRTRTTTQPMYPGFVVATRCHRGLVWSLRGSRTWSRTHRCPLIACTAELH